MEGRWDAKPGSAVQSSAVKLRPDLFCKTCDSSDGGFEGNQAGTSRFLLLRRLQFRLMADESSVHI
jgi:hypothetical protein